MTFTVKYKFMAASCTVLAFTGFTRASLAEVGVSAFAASRSTELIYNLSDGSHLSKQAQGSEYGMSFRYTPWLRIPASFGFTAVSYTLNTSSIASAVAEDDLADSLQYFSVAGGGKNTGLLYGPQVTAWYPSTYIQPYFRIGLMYGEEANTLTSESTTLSNVSPAKLISASRTDNFDVATNMIALGVSLSPIKILRLNHDHHYPIIATQRHIYTMAIFAEYSMETGTRTLAATSRSSSTTSDSTTKTTSTSKITSKEILDQESTSTMVRFGLEYRF